MPRWLATFHRPPERTYLVHGEPVAQDALKSTIEKLGAWTVHTPQHGEKVEVAL
ncbi:MAG: MBL fold metallo-hydrolase RNA specificity domain-containing protein [Vicinamibacterales bacterium]